MDKTAIKNFSIQARKKLIASVIDKAGMVGITKDGGVTSPTSVGSGFAVYNTHAGTGNTLVGNQIGQREKLAMAVKEKGFDCVVEEVVYTWFNRIIAIRFMEVNDYLPHRVRVLSSETEGKTVPDMVTGAPNIGLEFTEDEKEQILNLKIKDDNLSNDALFQMLFIKQCNNLHKVLPELFEKTSDYTELLLNISFIDPDGVIRALVDHVPVEDFNIVVTDKDKEATGQVEIIGWLYQYYNTEPKEETYALLKKNTRVTKERIPFITQLFTPDWIVRYIVENSLGRLWVEGHPNEELKKEWKYYLEEAEQEPNVVIELEKIRDEYRKIKVEDIKVVDPCMGSGHILVYAFDVLMQIYETCGYTKKDAARFIVEKNLYGIDIDDRAYQLAYFAVMMKGRQADRGFLSKGMKPNLCAIQESNKLDSFEKGAGQQNIEDMHKDTANYLIKTFRDGKEYGSILHVEQRDYDGLKAYIEGLVSQGSGDLFMEAWLNNISDVIPSLIQQAKMLSQKYDAVVTNPPYMGGPSMGAKLSDFVKNNYPDSKSDLFAVFIEKCRELLKPSGYQAMITQHAWMFLSSYEKLRSKLIQRDIVNMAHLGARAFGEISGEVVQTTAFVLSKRSIADFEATYVRLVDYNSQQAKAEAFLSGNERHTAKKENFKKIPGNPMAYWIGNRTTVLFNSKSVKDHGYVGIGMRTGDNDRFLRFWFEVERVKFSTTCSSKEETYLSSNKWIPYNKGGAFRKWFGNNEYVVNWANDGEEIKENTRLVYPQLGDNLGWKISNESYYFRPGLTWTYLTSVGFGCRYYESGHIFDALSYGLFAYDQNNFLYMAGLLNTVVASYFLGILDPTLKTGAGSINKIPYISNEPFEDAVKILSGQNISLSHTDWDSFETSWDFKRHPLTCGEWTIAAAFSKWECEAVERYNTLKVNEEELNHIFIDIYGLQDELTPEVLDKDVTVRRADLERDIRSFLSYAIGCMFGRYSLDVDGLAYAGGEWDESKYTTFIPDKDNIIPITDTDYFGDDIVIRFVDFLEVVYGKEPLEENLDFIANALPTKGNTPRDTIRNYFLKDFYKDHLKVYQKRPIYWLFDSGKENGFKALVYMHRYDSDIVGRVRTDYLHKVQGAIEAEFKHVEFVLDTTSDNKAKAKAVSQRDKLKKQLAETKVYDQAIAHIALQRIEIDLDDGVVVNYAKFQGIDVASEGKKTQVVDLLGKI